MKDYQFVTILALLWLIVFKVCDEGESFKIVAGVLSLLLFIVAFIQFIYQFLSPKQKD